MHFRSLIVAAAICGAVLGVARADQSGMTPMPGGKIYAKGAMVMGKPVEFEMKIDVKTMAMLHADMMQVRRLISPLSRSIELVCPLR